MATILTDEAENLLRDAVSIRQRAQWLALKQGRAFNLFDILGRSTDEVKGHSAFIAELLDPYGSHRQGTRFLQLFLDLLKRVDAKGVGGLKPEEDRDRWSVSTEWPIGGKDSDKAGRIDILLRLGKRWLVIENKIYAGDQPGQLYRYRRYARTMSEKEPILIYLTLAGTPPSQSSGVNACDVICISYKDIDRWIQKCLEASSLLPPIRENLGQYYHLIRRLMNSGNYEEVTMKITDSKKTLNAAMEIAKALPEAKARVQRCFWEGLERELDDFGTGDFIPGQKHDDPETKVVDYYEKSRNVKRHYGLSYEVLPLDGGLSFVWVVEVYNNLYHGLRLVKAHQKVPFKDHEAGQLAVEILTDMGFEGESGNLLWRYLEGRDRHANDNMQLNFDMFTQACVDLVQKKDRERVVSEIAKEIKDWIRRFTDAWRKHQ